MQREKSKEMESKGIEKVSLRKEKWILVRVRKANKRKLEKNW